MDAPFVIRFTPNRKDYIRVSRLLAAKSTGFRMIAILIILVMVAAAVVVIFPTVGNAALRNAALIALLVGSLYILFYLALIPFQFTRMYRSNEYLRMERQYVFSESEMTMHVGDQTSHLLWENFRNVIDGGGFYLLIYIGEKRIYPFIPRLAFTPETSEEQFLTLLKEKDIPFK